MTSMHNFESIDFTLLSQYHEMLGKSGVTDSLSTLETLMPQYYAELAALAEQRDETAFRRQAHKIKGACRSLGFSRLGEVMQNLERDQWSWAEAGQMLSQWESWLAVDIEQVKAWLAGKAE